MQQPENVVDYFQAIGESSGLDIIVHVYPASTRASYSFETLAATRPPSQWVKCMKVGTRDMNKYANDLRVIRRGRPQCHNIDLPRRIPAALDGAGGRWRLVGFASFIPQQIIDLYAAVQAGDLKKARWRSRLGSTH